MRRSSRTTWIAGWVAIALLSAIWLAAAQAAPFLVGEQPCGDLRKVQRDGKAVWQLTGCDSLEEIVACGCGEFVLDDAHHLQCACATPTPGPTVTWTSIPDSPTPTPVGTPVADCPQGELPPLNRVGFEGWYGREAGLNPGETHVYCFTVSSDLAKLEFAVGDKTGAAQCFWHTAEYLPPPDSWPRPPGPLTGRDTSYAFFRAGGFVPRGVWRVKITAADTSCAAKYQVVAHP